MRRRVNRTCRGPDRGHGMSLFLRKKEELSLHKIKQNGRRWLSGLLALIMIAGLFPATGITASAAGGGAGEHEKGRRKTDAL